MKNKLIIGASIVLSISIYSCNPKNPELKIIGGNTFNYGNVFVGDTVFHTFDLKNIGEANLEILKIVPSCSCTVAQIENKNIKPEETSKMTIRFISKSEDVGEGIKQIIIRTNADSSIVILNLTGNVKANAIKSN